MERNGRLPHRAYPALGDRAAALAIDALVFGLFETLVVPFVGIPLQGHLGWPWSAGARLVISVLGITTLFAIARSPGMSAIGLELLDVGAHGRPAGWRCFIRAVPTVLTAAAGVWVAILTFSLGGPHASPGHEFWILYGRSLAALGLALLPYLPAAFRTDKRSLWDILSGTVVVSRTRLPRSVDRPPDGR